MIFGDAVRAPSPEDATSATAWLADECVSPFGTVGGFVPDRYPAIVRVPPPALDDADWWARYRQIVAAIAAVGVRHTSTSDQAWFAIWDGYGWESGTSVISWREPPADEAERIAREETRAAARRRGEERRHEIEVALRTVPRFARPHRDYYLVTGPVAAAPELRTPGRRQDWQRPDLWWPEDRAWFVATDVDLSSLSVGAGPAMLDELRAELPGVETVGRADGFPAED